MKLRQRLRYIGGNEPLRVPVPVGTLGDPHARVALRDCASRVADILLEENPAAKETFLDLCQSLTAFNIQAKN